MAEYESIHGTRVRYLSSDPTLDSSTEGQVWYNSTTGTNKALVRIKAFSASGNIPTRFYYGSGVGPATTTLGFGGVGPSPQPAHNLTIEYNGFTWTGGGNLNTARRAMYQFGTPTAAVGAGGDFSPASPTISLQTEEYDGSSWTAGNNITEQGSFGAAAGTLTAGLAFGGYNTAQTASSTRTVSYDGTNWTAMPTPGADTNVSGNFTRGGGGTQTAAIFSGGSPYSGARGTSTETFDGSSWTSQNNMNTGRGGQGLLGTQSNALYAGGRTPARTGATEEWDGSAWATSSASLAIGRNGSIISQAGSTAAATIAGGSTGPAYPETTEEYNSNINAITKAAWASGGNMGTARRALWGAGTQTAGLVFGGYIGAPVSADTEEYNGTSWSEQNNLNTSGYHLSGTGTQTAGIAFARGTPTPNKGPLTEEYDGTSWSEQNDMGTARYISAGFGIQTAAGCLGGGPADIGAPNMQRTEEYDGSSWSDGGTFPAPISGAGGCGTLSAGLSCGGFSPPAGLGGQTTLTGEYDGSSWTTGGAIITANNGGFASGSQTDAVFFGGANPDITNQAQTYDGTSWVSSANLATARTSLAGSSTTGASALAAGGNIPGSPANTNSTEEFTGGTSVTTASTLTTS